MNTVPSKNLSAAAGENKGIVRAQYIRVLDASKIPIIRGDIENSGGQYPSGTSVVQRRERIKQNRVNYSHKVITLYSDDDLAKGHASREPTLTGSVNVHSAGLPPG